MTVYSSEVNEGPSRLPAFQGHREIRSANEPVHKRIAGAYAEFAARLGKASAKREVARRVYGDGDRFRDISRYMKPDGPAPRLPAAVALAIALEQKPAAFIDDPLVEIARELDAIGQVAQTLVAVQGELQDLRSEVARLALALDSDRVLSLRPGRG